MSLFGLGKTARNGNQNRPTESAQVNKTTEVDLWVSENGSTWALSRVNEQGGRSYRTMRPNQLVDAAEAIGFLCGVFSRDVTCPVVLQRELTLLNQELTAAVQKVRSHEVAKVNGQAEVTSLLSAA